MWNCGIMRQIHISHSRACLITDGSMVVCTVTRCQCRYLYPGWCGQEAPVRPPYYWLLLSATLVCVKFLQRRDQCGHLNTAGYMETCYTATAVQDTTGATTRTRPRCMSTLYLTNIFLDSLNIFSGILHIFLAPIRRYSRGLGTTCAGPEVCITYVSVD